MLLTFTLENYRSFRDQVSLELVRTKREEVQAFDQPDVAPVAAIFGANASGKSNLLRGLRTMFSIIRNSASRPDTLHFTPFLLGATTPLTTFEVSVRLDGVRYEYGFSYDRERIATEWLLSYPRTRQRVLYRRDVALGQEWYFGDSLSGPNQALAQATRDDSLLLSTAGLLNHPVLSPLFRSISGLVTFVGADGLPRLLQKTLEGLSANPIRRRQVERVLRHSDLGVVSFSIEENEYTEQAREQTRKIMEALAPEMTPDEIAEALARTPLRPRLQHASNGNPVFLPFGAESIGTQNLLALFGPIIETLTEGGVLVVDEIDTSLHPRLVSEVVRLFQDPEKNPRQAQLLISTHDVTVMMNTGPYDVLARDQLWFIQKESDGASQLYPLTDFKPRKDEVFSRQYLSGRYGAVPEIDDHAFTDLWADD